jgi:hypothetical protein
MDWQTKNRRTREAQYDYVFSMPQERYSCLIGANLPRYYSPAQPFISHFDYNFLLLRALHQHTNKYQQNGKRSIVIRLPGHLLRQDGTGALVE